MWMRAVWPLETLPLFDNTIMLGIRNGKLQHSASTECGGKAVGKERRLMLVI